MTILADRPQPAVPEKTKEHTAEIVTSTPPTFDVPEMGTSSVVPTAEVVTTSKASTFPTFPPMNLPRTHEDDAVAIMKKVPQSTVDAASQGRKRGKLDDVAPAEFKRLKIGGRSMLDTDFKEEDYAKMSSELLSLNLRHSLKVIKEAAKRVAQPQEDVVSLKQKVKDLVAIAEKKDRLLKKIDSQLVSQAQTMATQKEKIAEQEAILQANSSDLKSKDDQIHQLQLKVESDGLEIGTLHSTNESQRIQLEALQAKVDSFPSLLEISETETIAKYRTSSELEEDLTVLMRLAMRGGFVLAVNELVAAAPTSDVSSLEASGHYDPQAETLYDTYFDEFVQGVRIGVKYGASSQAATQISNPAVESSDLAANLPDPVMECQDPATS